MKKIHVLIFFVAFGLFYACKQNTTPAADAAEAEKVAGRALMLAVHTPDSLRSPEQRALAKNLEMIFYEHCHIKDNRFEIAISKKEVKALGVPEIYYNMLKRDVESMNHYLDTLSAIVFVELTMDAFRKSRDEYFAAKERRENLE
jgi:hypothetical protein